VELQEARVRVLEHYEEVIALEDEATCECRLVAASSPEPLIERCYVGVAFLAYLAASRWACKVFCVRVGSVGLGKLHW
jgi:hypothetical protein